MRVRYIENENREEHESDIIYYPKNKNKKQKKGCLGNENKCD